MKLDILRVNIAGTRRQRVQLRSDTDWYSCLRRSAAHWSVRLVRLPFLCSLYSELQLMCYSFTRHQHSPVQTNQAISQDTDILFLHNKKQ